MNFKSFLLVCILFVYEGLSWDRDLSFPAIRCDQLYLESTCFAEAGRCKWLDSSVCSGFACCKPITWCGYRGSRRKRARQCRKDSKHCKWVKNKRCVNREAHGTEASPWDKSNLCWFAAFNGQCDDLYYPNATGRWCMRGSDYSDCLMIHGEAYAKWIYEEEEEGEYD